MCLMRGGPKCVSRVLGRLSLVKYIEIGQAWFKGRERGEIRCVCALCEEYNRVRLKATKHLNSLFFCLRAAENRSYTHTHVAQRDKSREMGFQLQLTRGDKRVNEQQKEQCQQPELPSPYMQIQSFGCDCHRSYRSVSLFYYYYYYFSSHQSPCSCYKLFSHVDNIVYSLWKIAKVYVL